MGTGRYFAATQYLSGAKPTFQKLSSLEHLSRLLMMLPRSFIQRQMESGVEVNRSQSLDRPAGLLPATFDQGGPSAADRLTSSIGALLPIALCGRSSLYNKA
jgi:hypothetical protein